MLSSTSCCVSKTFFKQFALPWPAAGHISQAATAASAARRQWQCRGGMASCSLQGARRPRAAPMPRAGHPAGAMAALAFADSDSL